MFSCSNSDSANSWSRKKYDDIILEENNKLSTGPSNYVFSENSLNSGDKKCLSSISFSRNRYVPTDNIKLESELIGLENKNNNNVVPRSYIVSGISDCCNYSDHTRLSNPTCTFRSTGVNDFSPISSDPQMHISNPQSVGQSSTDLARKAHNKNCGKFVINYTQSLPNPNLNFYENNLGNLTGITNNLTKTTSLSYIKY